MIASIAARLGEEQGNLFSRNFTVLERDPLVVAAVAALVHVRDKIEWGILPQSCMPELWATYGAQVAAAVSGDYASLPAYRNEMAEAGYALEDKDFLCLVEHAMALGFQDKWPEDTDKGE